MGLSCQCPLSREVEVPYRGSLEADILFVGESPGREEIRRKSSFVGPSGQLLMDEMSRVGIDPTSVLYANSARCQISKNDLSSRVIKEILVACRTNLETLIHGVKPKVVVLLGAFALEQVMRIKGIKKSRGRWLWSEEFKVNILPMWHPAYILRNQTELENFRIDMEKLARFQYDGFEFTEKHTFRWMEVDTIRPLLDGGFMREDHTQAEPWRPSIRKIRVPLQESLLSYVTAIDTETQGLKWYDPNSIIISFSVAVNLSEGWTVYLHEEVPIEEADFTITVSRGGTKKKPEYVEIGIKRVAGYARKVEELRELCSRDDIKKYFLNQKYDCHRIYNLGITNVINTPMDVAVAAHCLDSERFLQPSLNTLVESFTNLQYNYKGDLNEVEKSDMLLTIKKDRDRVNRYSCFDAVATMNVAFAIKDHLIRDEKSMNYFVRFAQPIETQFLFKMERKGILIDREALPVVKKEIQEVMDRKIAEFIKLLPQKVYDNHRDKLKLTRRVILMEALFHFNYIDKYGNEQSSRYGFGMAPVKISPKTQLPTVDKDVRVQLLDNPKTPERAKDLILAYQEWSEYNTLMTRYIKNIEESIGPDGRIHPTFSLTFTSSGRTGARNPSIQNFPKRSAVAPLIRRLIIAPPGKKLLEADHSMAELRWIAHVAEERTMMAVFKRNGDVHLTTGLEVARIEDPTTLSEKELKDIRQGAKAINFGFVYGMSANGFVNYARATYHQKMSLGEARSKRNAYFNLYRDLLIWHNDRRALLQRNGYIRHVFGRRRTLPNIFSSESAVVAEAERIGINFEIQGPSSDATLMGGQDTVEDPRFESEEISVNIFTHDSLIFEVDEDKVDYYAGIVKERMEGIDTTPYSFQLLVPLVVESETGYNLAEMEKLKL